MKNKSLTKLSRICVLFASVLVLSSCATSSPNAKPSQSGIANQYTNDVFEVSALAERAYKESRWTDAAMHYQQLTEQIPGDAYIWFRLANTYTQKGDFNQAIHAYEMSIERDSLQPKPWFNLSTTYLLNAKAALLQSWENLRPQDPARGLIMQRIEAIDMLMNQELGEVKVNRG